MKDGKHDTGSVTRRPPPKPLSSSRLNKLFTYRGVTKSIEAWSEETHVPAPTLYYRLTHPKIWPVEKAMTMPYHQMKGVHDTIITLNGESGTFNDWSAKLGIKAGTLRMRLYRGHSPDVILNPKVEDSGFDPVYITYRGETHTISDWARKTGLDAGLIAGRYHDGWALDDVFSKDVGDRDLQRLTAKGETHTIAEWSEKTGLPTSVIRGRLRSHWSPESAVSEPKQKKGRKLKLFNYHGRQLTIFQLSEISGIRPCVLHSRLAFGWTIERAMSTPIKYRGGVHKNKPRKEIIG